MKNVFQLALVAFLIILSPAAANAVEYSAGDGVFLSRPGVSPSTKQVSNAAAEDLAYPAMGVGMPPGGQPARSNSLGAQETKSGPSCGSAGTDRAVWAKSPLARMIVLTLLFVFLGVILEIAVTPPFRKNVAEDLVLDYRNAWRLIMLFAILGGALLFPAAAEIFSTSTMGIDHRGASKGAM